MHLRPLVACLVASILAGCEPADNAATPTIDLASGPATTDLATGPEPVATPIAEASAPVATEESADVGVLTPENTKIEFEGTKKDGSHSGGFAHFTGTIRPIHGDFAASRIAVEIETESLFSDNPKLTNHLKAPDFFEVRKYPKASFVSTGIAENATDRATHTITGDLTLHGTTRSIDIPVQVTQADDALAFDGTFTIDRLDYGIVYQPDAVSPTVTITLSAKVDR